MLWSGYPKEAATWEAATWEAVEDITDSAVRYSFFFLLKKCYVPPPPHIPLQSFRSLASVEKQGPGTVYLMLSATRRYGGQGSSKVL